MNNRIDTKAFSQALVYFFAFVGIATAYTEGAKLIEKHTHAETVATEKPFALKVEMCDLNSGTKDCTLTGEYFATVDACRERASFYNSAEFDAVKVWAGQKATSGQAMMNEAQCEKTGSGS